MLVSTVTQKGQTTLPKKIRQQFDLNVENKLIYEIQNDSFIVRPHSGVMASYGVLKVEENSPATKTDVKDVLKQARENWADHAENAG